MSPPAKRCKGAQAARRRRAQTKCPPRGSGSAGVHFVSAPRKAPRVARSRFEGATEASKTVEILVGLATETGTKHAQRHNPPVASCPRCRFIQHGRKWALKSGGVIPGAERQRRVVWLAERPPQWGGPWAMGCSICTLALVRLSNCPDEKVQWHGRRLSTRWGRFEVNSLVCMQASSVAQHASTDVHRVCVRLFASPNQPVVELLRTKEEDALFRGSVPQPSDWLRVWRSMKCPQSWRALEHANQTEHFICSTRGRPVHRKAWSHMAEVLAEACRQQKREHLRAAWSITIMVDDKGGYRLIRYKCDALSLPGGVSPAAERGSRTGVVAVLRNGGAGDSQQLSDFSDDYAQRMADSIVAGIRRFATPLEHGQPDEALVSHVLQHCRVFCGDGASLKCGRLLRQRHMPNIILVLRDITHALRPALGAKTLTLDNKFAAQWDRFFAADKAFVTTLQHSEALQAKLQACQRHVLGDVGQQGGGLARVLRHLRFAPHRWESTEVPRRRLCCMITAVAAWLAYQAGDMRIPRESRDRAARTLESMNASEIVCLGLQADFTAEAASFLRMFDGVDHDPAATSRQKRQFIDRMRSLFLEGRVLADATGSECSMTSIAVHQLAEPISFRYGDKVHTLSMQGAVKSTRDALARVHLVTDVMIARIGAELPCDTLVDCCQAFDLVVWDAEWNLAAPRSDRAEKLLDKTARLLRALQLGVAEGLAQFEAAMPRALEVWRRHRIGGGVMDNRDVWGRIFAENTGATQALHHFLRFYLSVSDGTGTLERNLGQLLRVLGSHKGSLDQLGMSQSNALEVLIDGPATEDAIFYPAAACPGAAAACPGPAGGVSPSEWLSGAPLGRHAQLQEMMLPTEFGKVCATVWLACHGRRFSAMAAPRKDTGAKREPPAGTETRVIARRRAQADNAVRSSTSQGSVGAEKFELRSARQKATEKMTDSPHWNAKFAAFHKQTQRTALEKRLQEHARARGTDPYPVPKLRLGPGRLQASEAARAAAAPGPARPLNHLRVFVAVADDGFQPSGGRYTVHRAGVRKLAGADLVVVDCFAFVAAMPERRMGAVELWMALLIVGLGKAVIPKGHWGGGSPRGIVHGRKAQGGESHVGQSPLGCRGRSP